MQRIQEVHPKISSIQQPSKALHRLFTLLQKHIYEACEEARGPIERIRPDQITVVYRPWFLIDHNNQGCMVGFHMGCMAGFCMGSPHSGAMLGCS